MRCYEFVHYLPLVAGEPLGRCLACLALLVADHAQLCMSINKRYGTAGQLLGQHIGSVSYSSGPTWLELGLGVDS
jgi:hypothetical protein